MSETTYDFTFPYDDALENIKDCGKLKKNKRTGVDTISMTNVNTTYFLSGGFPILTRRKINYKACFAELLWFIEGSTSLDRLKELGCNYWEPWRSEQFEEEHSYSSGMLGPIYGFQLRNFGGLYNGGRDFIPYVDQLDNLIEAIRKDPSDRGLLISLWNPMVNYFNQGRLRPCAYSFQVLVNDYGGMEGVLTQRSADYPVGVPFNIIFYSAFLMMIAQQTGFNATKLHHNCADAHIYCDQMDSVVEYLNSPCYANPTLKLNKAADIFSYKMEDLVVENYQSGPNIKFPVAL